MGQSNRSLFGVTMNAHKRNEHLMPQFEPGSGKNDQPPVTSDEYKVVREGKGNPEQIARVRQALQDPDSPLYRSMGEMAASFALWHIDRKNISVERVLSAAEKNSYIVIEYVRNKREAGVLNQQDVDKILASTKHLNNPRPTRSHFAMGASAMMRTIIKLHPELESEVRSLPISSRRR
jgi:hypothetical protein